jgi:hypothetical protein
MFAKDFRRFLAVFFRPSVIIDIVNKSHSAPCFLIAAGLPRQIPHDRLDRKGMVDERFGRGEFPEK